MLLFLPEKSICQFCPHLGTNSFKVINAMLHYLSLFVLFALNVYVLSCLFPFITCTKFKNIQNTLFYFLFHTKP